MLAGLLVFIVVEKLFSLSDNEEPNEIAKRKISTTINLVNNNHKDLGNVTKCNNGVMDKGTNHIQVNDAYYLTWKYKSLSIV